MQFLFRRFLPISRADSLVPWSVSVGILNKHTENVWNFLYVSSMVCLGSAFRTILGQGISDPHWCSDSYSYASSQTGFLKWSTLISMGFVWAAFMTSEREMWHLVRLHTGPSEDGELEGVIPQRAGVFVCVSVHGLYQSLLHVSL